MALLLVALNPRPRLSLQLLIWRTPELPVGLWLAAGAGGGALLSASATGLALRQRGSSPRRRGQAQQQFETDAAEPWRQTWRETHSSAATSAAAGGASSYSANSPQSAPQRAPGEPTPTVAVPYRVLHRPSSRSAEAQQPAAPEPMAVADDWGRAEENDW